METFYDTAAGAVLMLEAVSRSIFASNTPDSSTSTTTTDEQISSSTSSSSTLELDPSANTSATSTTTTERPKPNLTAPRLRDFDPVVVARKQKEQVAMMQALPKDQLECHERWMQEAIKMAQEALQNDETPVGCVFVHNDKIIGRGYNYTNKTLNGTRHAEFVALAEVLQAYPPEVLKQTDLYVTVEPCIMCASALRQFGIRAVFFGCFNDRFGGNGGVLRIHEDENVDPGYPAYPDIFRAEAIMLLRQFYIQENEKAPEPKQKKTRELKTEIIPLDLTKHRNNLVTPPAVSRANSTPAAPASEVPARPYVPQHATSFAAVV